MIKVIFMQKQMFFIEIPMIRIFDFFSNFLARILALNPTFLLIHQLFLDVLTFQRVQINMLKHLIVLRTTKTDPKLLIFSLKKSESGYKWLFSEIGDAWPSKNRKFYLFLLFWPLWHMNNDFFRMQDWFRDFEAIWKSLTSTT